MNEYKLEHSEKLSCADDYTGVRNIIYGDNNHVLEHIKPDFCGRVKCIYIDPPYNNGERYSHYTDMNVHSVWIDNITETLVKLKPFLTEDGSIWVSIDDTEVHYLKVAADQVFGRENFVTTIIWEQRTTRENRKVFSNNHEYILVYAKNLRKFRDSRNLLPPTAELYKRYRNPDNDPRGPWQSVSANVQAGHGVKSQFYKITAPNGKVHTLPQGRCWIYNQERMEREISEGNIWFGMDGNGVPRIKKFLFQASLGLTPETLWFAKDVGTNKIAKKHVLDLLPDRKVFDTPKPEQLIKRIFDIATNEGDLILDAYLGSGTTTAVAHKMNRDYIGIEIGKHAIDYIVPRMNKVVDGEEGGISREIGWSGGGGFSFYQLTKAKRSNVVDLQSNQRASGKKDKENVSISTLG